MTRFSAGLMGHSSRLYSVAQHAAIAARCEDLGYDAFWVADQRWARDVWVTLAACAAATSRIQLGTRITDPYVRHPALTAVAAASLDEQSGGRAILGLGAGGSGFVQMGIARTKPLVALREATELIRLLWGGAPVEYEGEQIRFKRGAIEFKTRPNIPIVLAARGPQLLELGARIGDGVMLASVASPAGVSWAMGHVRSGMRRRQSERGALEVLSFVYVSLSDDRAAARKAVRRGVAVALMGSFPNLDFLAASDLTLTDELRTLLEPKVRDLPKIAAAIPDEYIDRLAIAGDADDCISRLREIVALGVDHVVLGPFPVEETGAEQLLADFATRVMPKVREVSG